MHLGLKIHALELLVSSVYAAIFLLDKNWPANYVKVLFEPQIASCLQDAVAGCCRAVVGCGSMQAALLLPAR